MTNGCYDLIKTGQDRNKSGDYNAALEDFNKVLQKCDAYDAKEKAYAGKAGALNGLKQYNDALTAARQGLQVNKTSIDNLFEKANAELGLGMNAEARADLNTIAGLTGKNRNIPQRATIYAKMAEAATKQQLYGEALDNIQQAISMDNSNLNFYMQRGDINVAAGNLSAAIGNYEEAIAKGKNDAEAWKAKITAQIKMVQKKYETNDAGSLAKKMSHAEKQDLCNSIRTAREKGLQDMTIDLVQTSICK